MHAIRVERSFESWRDSARRCLADGLTPEQIVWNDADADQEVLNSLFAVEEPGGTGSGKPFAVPERFVELARTVACHRDPSRWDRLYRVLWRITHGERDLLEIATDDGVMPLLAMEKNVRFDRHKMTAFVRFREVSTGDGIRYIAWYRPDHHIVRSTAPFFARRFATMRWSILTSDECAHWEDGRLTFTPGLPADAAPAPDDAEALWRTYYGSIFNPARIKINAMKKEMPTRFWGVLPETQDIDSLLRDAPRRVELMVANAPRDGATAFLPDERNLDRLREAAAECRGCSLCEHATRTVFGRGPADARAIVVGEQPGDQEDLAGEPFVGPAGELLTEALSAVGIGRESLYLTNVVKHFKFEQRGKRRIHSKPSAREMAACQPWLEAEIEAIHPAMILCLGNTAAQALIGREFRMMRDRGKVITGNRRSAWLMATLHPSALLRIPDPSLREEARRHFMADLQMFAQELNQGSRFR